ncbi:hypothetical protein [Rhizobium sp. 007]|uniref:hypothetical protein n=1 Tax=Rhizobium sp. 007 TaxID=2785056 RepID=UPI001FEE093B|nr:hypothetical protein [Rhizobium sp. 007]
MVELEIPLDGGADSTVVRVGQTVRRDGRSWSPAVLDLLQHMSVKDLLARRVRWALTTKGEKF